MTEIRPINALRAAKENDNKLVSPREVLQDVIADIDSGKSPMNKVLILMLDDSKPDGYGFNFAASNMKLSEMVALCEVMKSYFTSKIRGG